MVMNKSKMLKESLSQSCTWKRITPRAQMSDLKPTLILALGALERTPSSYLKQEL